MFLLNKCAKYLLMEIMVVFGQGPEKKNKIISKSKKMIYEEIGNAYNIKPV